MGLLIGDALGVPYEFQPPQLLPSLDEIEFEPPLGYERSHASVPPGTWSDDGAQALCLLESLLEQSVLDLENFGERLVAWHDSGHLAVDNFVFDCGIQTSQALSALRSGVPPEDAGPRGEWDNGNGSLMRVLPLVLWHRGTDEALTANARQQSLVTHGHRRAQLTCELYCLWARRILECSADPWDQAADKLRELHAGHEAATEEIEGVILAGVEPRGSGYVVDCLHSARLALRERSFERVVKAAVALGDDTDTTAAVAGGLAGLRDGVSAIPPRWRSGLRGQELVRPLLRRLVEYSGS